MLHQVPRILALHDVEHDAALAAGELLGHVLGRSANGFVCAVNPLCEKKDNDCISERHDWVAVNVYGLEYRMPEAGESAFSRHVCIVARVAGAIVIPALTEAQIFFSMCLRQ